MRLILSKDGERLVAAAIQNAGCIVQILTVAGQIDLCHGWYEFPVSDKIRINEAISERSYPGTCGGETLIYRLRRGRYRWQCPAYNQWRFLLAAIGLCCW